MCYSLYMDSTDGHVFLSDEPISSTEEDKFEHREYVDALVQILQNTEPPWNIGVFGKWGTGKSSIIRLLFDRLEDHSDFQDAVCVEFDAWKHAEDSIRTDLLLGIDRALGEETGETDENGKPGILGEDRITKVLYDVQADQENEDISTLDWLKRFVTESPVGKLTVGVLFVIFVGNLASVLGQFGILALKDQTLSLLDGLMNAFLIPFFLALFVFMAGEVHSAASTLRHKYPRKEWSGAYEQLFDEMVTDLVKKTDKETVIISVDNLDRCESETVYDVLVSLKTFMDNKRCIYIIPCDDEALLSHIQSIDEGDYFEDQKNEREFLRKFFQAHVRIPPFTSEAITDYASSINDQLEDEYGDEVISVITKAYVRNPRRIKQAFNRLTTLQLLAEELEGTPRMRDDVITDNLPFLAKISILQEDFPKFYQSLQKNPRLLDEFDDYFAGRISDTARKKELAAHFDPDEDSADRSAEGLKEFLRFTRRFRDDNPRPFIYLSEPSYALALEDRDRFVEDLRAGQIEKVREELRSLFDSDEPFEPYHDAIEDILNEWSHNEDELFVIIEALMQIFDVLDESAQVQVAETVSEYLVPVDRREFLEDLDPDLAFPMILQMPRRDAKDLSIAYSELVVTTEQLHENVLDAFVAHAENIQSAVKRPLAGRLIELRRNKKDDEFKTALDRIHSSPAAREKFVTSDLLKEAIKLIELDNNERDFENTEYYEKFDQYATVSSRSAFVERLLELRANIENASQSHINQNISNRLQDLEPNLLPEAARQLYSEFQGAIKGPNNNEQHLVETLFYYYGTLSKSTQDKFHQQCVTQLRNWDKTSQNYLNWAKQYNVPLLDSEDTVNSALNPFPTQNKNANVLTNTVLPLIPEEFNDIVSEKLVEIIESNDDSEASLGAKMFATSPARFSSVQDTVVRQCLNKAKNTNDTETKKTYLIAVGKVFHELDESDQELFISHLSSLARGNNQDQQAVPQVWREVEDRLELSHRQTIGQNILSVLEDEATNQNQPVPSNHLVQVLQSLTEELAEDAHAEFIERLSNKLMDGGVNYQQKETILDQLAGFKDFAGHEDLVLTRIEGMLKQNSQNRLHQTTKEKLGILEQREGIAQNQIREIREQHLNV